MLKALKDFFFDKQTFASAVSDVAGFAVVAGAWVVGTPDGQAALAALAGPYAPAVLAGIAFIGYTSGAISGRKTKP